MKVREILALVGCLGIIPALWVLDGMGIVNLSDQVIGATISVWTLVFFFHFRKKPGDEK